MSLRLGRCREFHDDATTISWQFGLLALSAALIAPLAIYLGRCLGTSRLVRASVYVGIGAAVVQVIGLLRWPILVPGLADTATDRQRPQPSVPTLSIRSTP